MHTVLIGEQSLLDTSKRTEITEAFELNLSRDEDSVTTLAVAPQSGDDADSLTVLAGINSSIKDQKKNNNKHMRSFRFQVPQKVASDNAAEDDKTEQDETKEKPKEQKEKIIPGEAQELSRASIFRTKKGADQGDTYQRVLRLSRWQKPADGSENPSRVGAIATGLASSGEIVFFNVTESPTESDVIGRIRLASNEEAEDVDFTELYDNPDEADQKPDRLKFAYTNGVEVFVGQLSLSARSNAAPDVRKVYTIPLPKGGQAARPKFRALRFLTSTTLLLLRNAPNRSGSELLILDFSTDPSEPSGAWDEPMVIRTKKLPRSMKIALGLDVCPLGTNPIGQRQFIIAASGSDNSIAVWTLEYGPKRGFGKILHYTTLRDLHPFSMTKLCFSPFTPPSHPLTPEVPPQRVKLASVSMGNTVVVHTFPLSPFPASSRTARYTLSLPGPAEVWELLVYSLVLFASLGVVVFAMWLYAEIRGVVPPFTGVQHWLPGGVENSWAAEYIDPSQFHISPVSGKIVPRAVVSVPDQDKIESLKSVLDRVHEAGFAPADLEVPQAKDVSVIVRCHDGQTAEQSVLIETSTAAHGEQPENLCAWKDLSEADQAAWKQRLTDAGRWAVSEGEAILHGVLFSEACSQLARAVREGLP